MLTVSSIAHVAIRVKDIRRTLDEGLRHAETPYLSEGADPEGGWLWGCAASAAEAQSMSRTG
jgi:hypothetical protein